MPKQNREKYAPRIKMENMKRELFKMVYQKKTCLCVQFKRRISIANRTNFTNNSTNVLCAEHSDDTQTEDKREKRTTIHSTSNKNASRAFSFVNSFPVRL